MIAAAIIFCTLLLAFFDKPELFKKPIKFEKIIIIVFLLGTAIFSLIKENKDDGEKEKSAQTIDSLNAASHVLNKLVDTLRTENKVAQREYVDSFVSYHLYTTNLLASYGLKVDTLTGTIIKMDKSIMKETPPTLRIREEVTVMKNEQGEYLAQFILESLNADVHIKGLRYIFLNFKNGKALEDEIYLMPSLVFNYTSIISKGEERPVMLFMDRFNPKDKFKRTDTCIVAVECEYKSKSNTYQTPVRKIYLIITEPVLRGIELPSGDHLIISNILKKKKVWPVFYDL